MILGIIIEKPIYGDPAAFALQYNILQKQEYKLWSAIQWKSIQGRIWKNCGTVVYPIKHFETGRHYVSFEICSIAYNVIAVKYNTELINRK